MAAMTLPELMEEIRKRKVQIAKDLEKLSTPKVWVRPTQLHPSHYNVPVEAFHDWLPGNEQLSLPDYSNLQPETATEMEVPCPRCGHRAAPEHIVKLAGKHGYGCKCWSCQFTWEHEA